jgi:aspartate/glutamate racemase
MGARIALVHAVKVAIAPVEDAFRRHWPEAELINLLDDSLSRDRSRERDLTPALKQRIAALAEYGIGAGAQAVLYTCSAFGEAIEAVKRAQKVPVLRPNEAMFDEALKHGKRLGMLASFGPTVGALEAELRELDSKVTVKSVCVPEAMKALDAGDGETHDRLLARVAPQLGECDAIMLAQFSTARAHDAVAATVRCPVITSPTSAVLRLRQLL